MRVPVFRIDVHSVLYPEFGCLLTINQLMSEWWTVTRLFRTGMISLDALLLILRICFETMVWHLVAKSPRKLRYLPNYDVGTITVGICSAFCRQQQTPFYHSSWHESKIVSISLAKDKSSNSVEWYIVSLDTTLSTISMRHQKHSTSSETVLPQANTLDIRTKTQKTPHTHAHEPKKVLLNKQKFNRARSSNASQLCHHQRPIQPRTKKQAHTTYSTKDVDDASASRWSE